MNAPNSSKMTRKFAVVGNPVAHSKSPFIHESFSRQTGIALSYDRLCATVDAFESTVSDFFLKGGCGLNITVPFKEQAWALAQEGLSERARIAGAVNTLWQENGVLKGCNTDGVGLLTDLHRLNANPEHKRVLLIGAGGASKGVIFPLLEAGCAHLHVINRTAERALALRDSVISYTPDAAERLHAGALDSPDGAWDIVINATSSSMGDRAPAVSNLQLNPNALAYDMFYAAEPTAFMRFAQEAGADRVSDGLGMLVGQAAASFQIWNGVLPDIDPVLATLRQQITHG